MHSTKDFNLHQVSAEDILVGNNGGHLWLSAGVEDRVALHFKDAEEFLKFAQKVDRVRFVVQAEEKGE